MKKGRNSAQIRRIRRHRRQRMANYHRLLAQCRNEDAIPASTAIRATRRGWLDANGLLVLTQQGTQWVLQFLNPRTRRQVCLRISNYLGLRNMLADIYRPA